MAPTQEELLALWNKSQAQKARDLINTKARNTSVTKLIAAHEAEYEKYLKEAKAAK